MQENNSIQKDTSMLNNNQPEWIIFGAGRIGKGLVNLIASEHGFKTTLIVREPPTYEEAIRIARSQSYNIRLFEDIYSEGIDREVRFSRFLTKDQSLNLIDEIANPNVEVISTSVGFENLESISGIITQGIKKRIDRKINKKLYILVFENGLKLYNEGEINASEYFLSLILNKLSNENIDINKSLNHIVIPNLIFDCYIPNLPKNSREIIVKEKGNIWIEENEESRILLNELLPNIHNITNLHRVNSIQMRSYHYLKHFGFNSLNVMYALIALIRKQDLIDQAINSETQCYLDDIRKSIISAIPLASRQSALISPSFLHDYCNSCHNRLNHEPNFEWFKSTRDSINRIYHKILGNDYSDDARIFGPLKCLLENSKIRLSEETKRLELYDNDGNIFFVIHKSLIHIVSIYLLIDMKVHEYKEDIRSVISNRDILYNCFDIKKCIGNTKIELFIEKEIGYIDIESGSKEEWLVNALSDNIRHLCISNDHRKDDHLSSKELNEYLAREIQREKIKIPSSLSVEDLELVIFDLDEGIVNSESALFEITNEIIREQIKLPSNILDIDEYPDHIGESEAIFFNYLKDHFDFRNNYSVHDFINDRDEKYLRRLQNGISSVAHKPGFVQLLRRLSEDDIDIEFAINSNASRNRVEATLKHIDCKNFFTEERSILCATDSNMEAKPSSLMIRTTLRNYATQSKNCLIIESTDKGLIAARNAGCFCMMIANDFSNPQTLRLDQRGKIVFDNMLHLKAWLDNEWDRNKIPP